MPGIVIKYRREALDFKAGEVLKKTLREEVRQRFSTRDITLSDDGFTFTFHEEGLWDELTHDVIVGIQLHHFHERLVVESDVNAIEIAEAIAKAFHELHVEEETTVGVSLLFADIGWGAAIADVNFTPMGDSR